MKTVFILLAQYETAVIPLDVVCRDYFQHMTTTKFAQKLAAGDIDIPVFRADPSSQKTARGVHIHDLAAWIDARRAAAIKECDQLHGRR